MSTFQWRNTVQVTVSPKLARCKIYVFALLKEGIDFLRQTKSMKVKRFFLDYLHIMISIALFCKMRHKEFARFLKTSISLFLWNNLFEPPLWSMNDMISGYLFRDTQVFFFHFTIVNKRHLAACRFSKIGCFRHD